VFRVCEHLPEIAKNSRPTGIGDRKKVRGPYCRREYPDQQARPDAPPVHPWHRPRNADEIMEKVRLLMTAACRS